MEYVLEHFIVIFQQAFVYFNIGGRGMGDGGLAKRMENNNDIYSLWQ